MTKITLITAAIALTVSSPAFADKYFAVTPSGAAETLFPDSPPVVVGKLSSKCIDAHWTVTSSSSNELVCESPMNFGQSLLGQLAMGNSYSTPPRRFFRFNIAEINGISRVQASGWVELQMAFGQMKRTDFSGPTFQNSIIIFMTAAGGKLPVGTTYPNHIVIGVGNTAIPYGNGLALRVESIEPGSAAEKAGLQVGDIITSVAHKHFKNAEQSLDASAKAAESPTYDVELVRAGKQMTVSLERRFRPPVTETVVASHSAPPAATQPVRDLNVADEIAKLSTLKDKGVITGDEFAAQKKKLLGN